ncbi:MAG TPA: hypothetical protein VE973_01105 [Candidatus Limnocylindria bacterium]|nr:hypothetical protein [Candidatus Limnocylindria bacterium]
MTDLVKKFKNHVTELSNNSKDFIHHEWFVKYHLEIVEKIALELCAVYKNADKDLVILMVWLHDYGKIIDFTNEHSMTLTAGKDKLLELGFSQDISDKAINYIELLDKKESLESDSTPIEIKIVSSADGAAHLVGPFFHLWWYENPKQPFQQLIKDNIQKSTIDWEKKIVLPEIKKAFEQRHNFLLEQAGNFPEKFLL